MADSEDTRDDLQDEVDQQVDHEVDQEVDGVHELNAADPEGRLAAATAEIESLKDQALRSQAEAENVRRRAARDVENVRKFALEKFASDLLPVIDSLEKGVESAQLGAETTDAGAAKAIAEGVRLSLKLFYDVLEKAGIARIDPVGEPFDPQLHEAMAVVENPDAEPNSVLEVMQTGYTLNGRLIRAAMVVVSKAQEASG